ncbi:MAG TPA: hypothetical protein VIL18_14355 [Longimicrobiales bacterium]
MLTRLAAAARRARIARAALLPAALVLALATPALAGPPWISIEYPANPLDPTTRGALMVIRTYHHADPMAFPVSALAEGLLEGGRRTVQLRVERAAQPGVWVVRGELPKGGSWVVTATLSEPTGGEVAATALVALGPAGDLMAVQVPYEIDREGWIIPRPATRAEVESLIRMTAAAAAAKQQAARTVGWREGLPTGAALAGLAALFLLPAGVGVVGRRRRSL